VCGRFSLTASGEELVEAFDLDEPPVLSPRYNIAPSQPVLVVRAEGGRRRAASLRWGLSRAGEPDSPGLLINARSESVPRRPAFRESFRTRRCLIPADGFYEWKRGRDGSDPFHLRRRDKRLFAFAGLWTPASPGSGTPGACVILTTEASDVVASVHDRMPVILPPEAYEAWLAVVAAGQESVLEGLLRPLPAGTLEARPVSPAVNSAANEGPQCQAPAPERPVQGLLFPQAGPR
jgi:putative SOS response-associated peptidase YedK